MKLEPADFFVLRTPLLPFDDFLNWSEGLEAAKAHGGSAKLEQAIGADRLRLRARLVQSYARPEVREALFVASPHLDESFQIWEREPESERGQGIELALVRYFVRMAGRPTPFGLCAGCSTGRLGAHTRFVLPELSSYQRHTRLDMDYLYALCETLARDPALRRTLVYRPNSSLYRAADRLRYVEARLEEKKRSYHLVAVEETEALRQSLARAETGAGFAELAKALVDEEVSSTDAEGYIDELIESQILIPDLLPGVTGPEAIEPLISQLQKHANAAQAAEVLQQVHTELAALDNAGLGNPPERYRAIGRALEKLPSKVELPHLFQVDMVKPASSTILGKAVVDEIVHGINVLHRLVPSSRPADTDELKRFREAFVTRYESREVPLTEALDAEMGIGFPIASDSAESSPLLRGLEFPTASEATVPWERREKFLLQKLSDSLQSGADEIVLQPHDLEKISAKDPLPLPDAFSVTATVAAASDNALARGDFHLYLQGASGPSGARFLGRFCHADETLHPQVETHLRAEEALRPEAIFAEITHLPEGRLGNILARPILREYEIPYLAPSSVPSERQIPVTDLLIAVRGDRIVLRSARLNREVIPRLTSAHNFQWGALGLYQFLGMLQAQSVTGDLGWSWGPLENAPFLPRVTLGRLVLARARWRIGKDELKQLTQARGAARFRAATTLRQGRRLPRTVLLAEGDNALPLDLENVLSVETFVNLSQRREEVRLMEIFPPPDQLCARGPEGRFVHEVIVPFVRKADEQTKEKKQQAGSPAFAPLITIPRTFPPGSEWLYAKLYTGTANADYLLRKVISPLVSKLLSSGGADRWFFIRYSDPEFYLRLRFHGIPKRLHSDLLPAIEAAVAPLLGDGRIWRMQFDTYEREIERYGGPEGMLLAEQIFHADSEAVLKIIERLDAGDPGLDERWRLTLRGIDMLLQDLGFDPTTKLAVLRKVRTKFAKEFNADANLRGQIGDRFRKERKDLETLLDPRNDVESQLEPGLEILQRRSAALRPIMAELKACDVAAKLSIPLEDLAPSYIHMHANRLLRSAHRAHELVLYDFLARLYDAQLARRHTS